MYSDTVNQWMIYDAYKKYEKIKEEREKAAEDKENENEEEAPPPEPKQIRKRLIETPSKVHKIEIRSRTYSVFKCIKG